MTGDIGYTFPFLKKEAPMPWKESSVMDERTKFISKLIQGEKMTHVCAEFGISRKTGHKLWNRYQSEGFNGLGDKNRAPHRKVRLTPPLVEKAILGLKKEKPHWGAAKIREIFKQKYAGVKDTGSQHISCYF